MKTLDRILPETPRGTFILAFMICLAAGLFIITVHPSGFGGTAHDGYLEIARNIMAGKGFVFDAGGPPELHRPPLYPLLLAPITLLPAYLQRPVLVVLQSLMIGGTACLTFLIARGIFGLRTARLSVLILLLDPWVYITAKNPMSIVLQSFLYALFMALVIKELLDFKNRPAGTAGESSWWKGVFLGLSGAALVMSHGTMLAATAVVLVLLFGLGLIRRDYKKAAAYALSSLIIILFIMPWAWRNWTVFGRFVPVTGNAGFTYFVGDAHWGIGGAPRQKGETEYGASLRHAGLHGDEKKTVHFFGLTDPGTDAKADKNMVAEIKAHPANLFKKVFLNAAEFYIPSFYEFYMQKANGVAPKAIFKVKEDPAVSIFYLLLWALAVRGMIRTRSGFAVVMASAPIILYAVWYLPFLVFVGHNQYTLGTIPFISMLAAEGLGKK